MSVELCKAIFDWGTVFLIGLTFVFGAGALITGNILNERQEKALEDFKLKMEDEQQKTALAQKEAAEAQLALKHNIEYAAEPRRIVLGSRDNDQEIRDAKFKELEKYAGTRAIITFVPNSEDAKLLAFDIRSALAKSHWKPEVVEGALENVPLGYIEAGVQVRTFERVDAAGPMPESPVARAVVDLLRLDLGPPRGPMTGVVWAPDVVFNGNAMGLTRYGFKFPDGAVVITVGAKPTWEYFITH